MLKKTFRKKKEESPILAIDRHKSILQLIKERESVTVQQISQLLGVSHVTARKDLDILASKGLIVRTRGGASMQGVGTSFEPLYYEKKNVNRKEKMLIAKAAAEFVRDGETVILDSGSTSFEMVGYLKSRVRLTVITYDLILATELSTNSGITVIIAGGVVRNNLYTTRGPITLDTLKGLHANKTFLTVDAIDVQHGITNATLEGASIKRALIDGSDEVIVIADHSKFGLCSLAHVASLDAVSRIITDEQVPHDILDGLEVAGVRATVVSRKTPKRQGVDFSE